ncbi:MAG TPA: PDZ domain-containing protein [Burkholderiales bacterium]|nr:PDZ domain-containing protein [Burkholderiales bacterium]
MTRYRIAPLDPHAHLFEVGCTVDDPDPAGQRFRLPTWIPGSYLIREFARQFIDVRAEAGGGPVAIEKEGKDVWRAAPADAPLTVIARVHAFDLSVRTAYLDATRAYFNGPSVFLCPEGREQAPCTLEIVAPAGERYADWRVATTLDSDGAPAHRFGRYRAGSYDALIDHPVEMSDFALAAFAAGGVRHEIAVTGRQHADLERLAQDLARVCQWHVDLFGGKPGSAAPFDRYLFQVAVVGDGYGGLEHRSSTSLLCRRDELPAPGRPETTDDYVGFLGLASHEYFHAWNVKRIVPAAFAPYDLAREGYTRQLWAFEGITSYYDDLALVRSGLIDPPRYLELLGRTITSVLRTPGRQLQSIAESSFDAWIKFYRPDENAPNAGISYYWKGSLVALALDLLLRKDWRTSLDAVLRTLWQRHGRTGVGVPEGGIERIVEELAGAALRPFFDHFVHGTEDPPLGALLDAFGIDWHLRAASGPGDRGGKPSSGPSPACWLGAKIGNDQRLQHVYSGGPAERAGLAPQDVLVAIDGIKASAEALNGLLARRSPGERVPVHAFRRDELFSTELELASAPLDTCYLSLRSDAPNAAVALRDGWLTAT